MRLPKDILRIPVCPVLLMSRRCLRLREATALHKEVSVLSDQSLGLIYSISRCWGVGFLFYGGLAPPAVRVNQRLRWGDLDGLPGKQKGEAQRKASSQIPWHGVLGCSILCYFCSPSSFTGACDTREAKADCCQCLQPSLFTGRLMLLVSHRKIFAFIQLPKQQPNINRRTMWYLHYLLRWDLFALNR